MDSPQNQNPQPYEPGVPPPARNPYDSVPAEPPLPPERSDSTVVNTANGFKTVLGAIFSWLIFPAAVVLILHFFVFQAFHVLGTSMVPTLHETDYLIISKIGTTETSLKKLFGINATYLPARGQVIVFHYPQDPSKVFVKRVVGLPGDRIIVKNGNVSVINSDHPNGFNPDTSYEPEGTTTLIDTDEVVRPGNLFVMGDNRTPGGSFDSREWGELPSSYIIGHAVLRLLPLDQVRFL